MIVSMNAEKIGKIQNSFIIKILSKQEIEDNVFSLKAIIKKKGEERGGVTRGRERTRGREGEGRKEKKFS